MLLRSPKSHHLPLSSESTDRSLHKEEDIYRQEVVAATTQLDKLKNEGADGADIRNAVSVLCCSNGLGECEQGCESSIALHISLDEEPLDVLSCRRSKSPKGSVRLFI